MRYLVVLITLLMPLDTLAIGSDWDRGGKYDLYFIQAADHAKIGFELLRAVCWVESNHRNVTRVYDNGRPAYGVCQVQLPAARDVGFTGSPQELKNPAVNIRIAALYLAKQLSRYKGDWRKAVIAYNRGNFKRAHLTGQYLIKITLALREGR